MKEVAIAEETIGKALRKKLRNSKKSIGNMGLRQQFKIRKYDWDVVIYYTVDEKQKTEIVTELKELQPDKETFEKLERNLMNSELDTGFIYSSFYKKFSLIVIHKASSIGEFVNTFEHEKNHLEMHICEALDINPYSEEAAILSGETAMQILNEALYNIAEL